MNDIFDKFFGGKFDAFGDIFSDLISQPNKKSNVQYEKDEPKVYTPLVKPLVHEKKPDGFILQLHVPGCKLKDITLLFNSHTNMFTVKGISSDGKNKIIDREFKINKQLNYISNHGIEDDILTIRFYSQNKNSIPIYLET